MFLTRKGEYMKSAFLFSFIFSALMSVNAFSKENILATISSDENNQVFTFIVETDDSTNAISSFYKDNYIDGKRVKRDQLSADKLTQEGVVLDQRGNNTVIDLKSDNYDSQTGGDVVIDTLYNGINGERKQYNLSLAQSKDGWALFNDQKIITKLKIEVNKKPFIGSIGVKNIQMN